MTDVGTRSSHEGLTVPAHGVRAFVVLTCGQFIAVTGLTLFNFAGALYFFRTDSPLTFTPTVVGFLFALPFIVMMLAAPVTGALVDRWGPRKALLVSNIGGILLVATLAVVPLTHTLTMWHAAVIVMTVPILKALLLPAYEAAVPLLVPKRHIGRANGTRLLFNGIGALLGPIAAPLLLPIIGIYGIGLTACLSLGLGILALLPARIPRVRQEDAVGTGMSALLADVRQAWHYVQARHGLLAVLVFFGATGFGIGFVEVLTPNLVQAFASPDALNAVLVVGLAGMAATSIALTISGGPRRRVRGMLEYSLLFAAAMVIGSLRPNLMLIAVAAFVALGSTSIVVGIVQTIVHTKVEPHLLGRVMGFKYSLYAGLTMTGNILSGLAGGALLPLIGEHHVRSSAVAAVVGAGPGRGWAVLMMVTGGLIAISVLLVGRRGVRLRVLEDVLPDVTPEDVTLTTAGR